MNTSKKRGRPAGIKYVPASYRLTAEQKAHIEAKGGVEYMRALVQADMEAEVRHESN